MAQGQTDADQTSQDERSSDEPEGLLGGLHRERLPNGVHLWHVPMASQKMVALRLAVPAGAQYEEKGESGLAHFVEHIFADRSFEPDIETLWSDIEDGGGMVNALTSPEQVVFAVELRPDQLSAGLELIQLCLTKADFSPEHVENERRVIHREIHAYGERNEGLSSLVWKRLLQEHPITRNPAGDLEGIQSLDAERLESFFRERYAAGGLTLIVTGGVELERTRAEVMRTLGTLEPSDAPPKIDPPEMSFGFHRIRESRNLEEVLVGYRVSGVQDPDYFALWYIRDHLDELLYERIRREMHVYHLSCELIAGPSYGVMYVWAQLPAVDHDRLVAHVDGAFARLTEGPLDDRTWSKLRQRMVNRSRRLSETSDELAFHLLGLANHYDVDEPVPDDVLVLAEVERTDLFDAACRHFDDEHRIEARARQHWIRSHMRYTLLVAVGIGLLAGLWENCHQREKDALIQQIRNVQSQQDYCVEELEECSTALEELRVAPRYRLVGPAADDALRDTPDAGDEGAAP